jgi:hypothetical protein
MRYRRHDVPSDSASLAPLTTLFETRRGRALPLPPRLARLYGRRRMPLLEQVIPFFAFPPAVRRIIYTTNAIESLHSEVRKAVRGRGHFPSDEAATKLIWLTLRNITAKWKNPPIAWHAAKAQFAIQFEDRFVITWG